VARSPSPQQALEQSRGPDLAVAGNQVAHRRRRRAHETHRLQDARDVSAVLVEVDDVSVVEIAVQQVLRDADMAQAQFLDAVVERGVLSFGQVHERQQRVRDAPARRQHDGLARRRIGFDDSRNLLHARGICHAGAPEFMDFPGFQGQLSCAHPQASPAQSL